MAKNYNYNGNRNNNRGNRSKSKMERKNTSELGFASAPYNFIPFPDKYIYRYGSRDELPTHDRYHEGLLSGNIEYTVENEELLFISDGKGGFFKVNGKACIPGSTMRGKVRSNMEILSSAYPEFIEDRKFSYREVGSRVQSSVTKQYKRYISPTKFNRINKIVKVGIIYKEDHEYYIHPLKKLKEGQDAAYFEFVKEKINGITNTQLKKIDGISLLEDRGYKPYIKKIKCVENDGKLELKNQNDSVENGDMNAYLMNSNKMFKKNTHYLISSEIEKGYSRMKIDTELVEEYNNRMYKIRKFRDKKDGDFMNDVDYYQLPEKSGQKWGKPVFYLDNLNDDNKTDRKIKAFGFTPYLRIPYECNIKDGVVKKEIGVKKEWYGIDYPSAIMGYTREDETKKIEAYKGRVYFENAFVQGREEYYDKTIFKMLINPKPTSFQLYLDQREKNGNYVGSILDLITYNGRPESGKDGLRFRLRGNKFYWLKDLADRRDSEANSENQMAKLRPMMKGHKFKGIIRFENLHEDELGLLLMSIKPNDDAKENIGQGKPYGFGKVNIGIDKMEIVKKEDMFKSMKLEGNSYSGEALYEKTNTYISVFMNKMKSDFETDMFDVGKKRLWAFYMSKIQEQKRGDDRFDYMDLQRFKERELLEDMEEHIESFETYRTLNDLKKKIQKTTKSMSTTSGEDVLRETKRILVYSKTEEDWDRISKVMSQFKYVDRLEIDEQPETGYDLVVFNGFDGEGDKLLMDSKIDQNSPTVYFFMGSGRYMSSKTRNLHFSNSIITLYDNLMQAIRYHQINFE